MNPTIAAMLEIGRIIAAVCLVRTLAPDQLGAIVAACRDNGAGDLADCLIGTVPFDGTNMRDRD